MVTSFKHRPHSWRNGFSEERNRVQDLVDFIVKFWFPIIKLSASLSFPLVLKEKLLTNHTILHRPRQRRDDNRFRSIQALWRILQRSNQLINSFENVDTDEGFLVRAIFGGLALFFFLALIERFGYEAGVGSDL